MKNLKDIAEKLDLKLLCGTLDREVGGCYAGDLLSWVMSNATEGDIWITIMSNINVVAVAGLTDRACVVMSEGVTPDEDVLQVAKAKGVTIFTDNRSTFELCCLVGKEPL